jgi:hypothetical protein
VASFAQSNLLKKNTWRNWVKTAAQLISDNDKPLAYGYVHDRDVLMGKMTWEIIDLSEKINFPSPYWYSKLVQIDDLCMMYWQSNSCGDISEVYLIVTLIQKII